MSFLEEWECDFPKTDYSTKVEILNSNLQADKKTVMFLKKISSIRLGESILESTLSNSKEVTKINCLLCTPMLKHRFIQPTLNNINITYTPNISQVYAGSSIIVETHFKIRKNTAHFLASTTKKEFFIFKETKPQSYINPQNYQLLKKVECQQQSKKPFFDQWSFNIYAGNILANEVLRKDVEHTSENDNIFQCAKDRRNMHTFLLKHNKRNTSNKWYFFKRSLNSNFWKLPENGNIDLKYLSFSEKFDNRIFFCKKIPSIIHQKPKHKFKYKMWMINSKVLKKMSWRIFILDSRANLLTAEKLQTNNLDYFVSSYCNFFEENIFDYIFSKVMDFRISIKNIKTGLHNQETFLYRCKNEDEAKQIGGSQEDLQKNEFDLLIQTKNASFVKSSNNDITNVAVNESTFYFDSTSITNSTFKLNISSKTENIKPSIFCNFNRLNKRIIQKLYKSAQIMIFEGEDKDFANLKCQIVLNQKSCVFFTMCSDFIQVNSKTKQLYIYQEIMQLCEIFENIYIVFTDCEDQTIERRQRCKLALLENFQQYTRIHVFELESKYFENEFTEEILIPLVVQNSSDFKHRNLNYLLEDDETIYILLTIGFDLYTSNILNTVSSLINKIISNTLTKQEQSIVTKRIHDKIVRYIND